jgi:hypothetical protein
LKNLAHFELRKALVEIPFFEEKIAIKEKQVIFAYIPS